MLKGLGAIYKREVSNYFYSSIAYVFIVLFLFIPNIFFFYFFGGIFKEDAATLRRFFDMMPYVFVFFIPGLTMGSWSKERNTGTLELVFTFPVSEWAVLLGKFFATMTVILVALASTLVVPVLTHIFMGEFDLGQLASQYIGVIILAATYVSVGFFMSSLTKELIFSFLSSAALLLLLTIVGYLTRAAVISFPEWLNWLKVILYEISLSTHFANFSKGVIHSKDVLYYAGIIVIFFYLNLKVLSNRK